MQKTRDVFPIKTAQYLSDITGYSVRSCEYWLSEKVAIPADALSELLRSDWGREFLSVVMADASPRWWRQLLAWLSCIDFATAERKRRRKLKELLDGDFYTLLPSAHLVQDEEFYRAQPAPDRRPHRAVVAAKKITKSRTVL